MDGTMYEKAKFQSKYPKSYENLMEDDLTDSMMDKLVSEFNIKLPSYIVNAKDPNLTESRLKQIKKRVILNDMKKALEKEKTDWEKGKESSIKKATDKLKAKIGKKHTLQTVYESAEDGIITEEEKVFLLKAMAGK